MSGTTLTSDGLDARRKRLLFRSWHRGMRELDLILGAFADANIVSLTDNELDEYEHLLTINDTDVLPWLMGERPFPGELSEGLINKIKAFRPNVQN